MNKLKTKVAPIAAVLACAIMLCACGQNAAEQSSVVVEAKAAVESTTLPVTPSPEGAAVHFIAPADGSTVTNPIRLEFGISGMDVVKAGNNQPDSGHHHLLIDTGLPDLSLPIPADGHHIHFGDGSTVAEITLDPGEHTLQLLLGDYLHIPHDPPVVSQVITVSVE